MSDGEQRASDQLRPVKFELNYTKWAEGSVLTKFGDTHVLCNATVEADLPRWLKKQGAPHGWVTGEYAMLPRSTQERRRERLFPGGRTQEISRLIGRSLRSGVALEALGERQVIVDCTVLQADGGTRTAAITGGWLAIALALRPLIAAGKLPSDVLKRQIAAISVGLVGGEPLLDLAYEQDVAAGVDLNVVMTAGGQLVDVQGTGEKAVFSRAQLDELLTLAERGIQQLVRLQNQALNGQ
ncbi:MAG: ribonuclease PH [Chloroflexota bacterium]